MKNTRLSHTRRRSPVRRSSQLHRKYHQHGIALAIALILLGVLMVFTSLVATLMTSEARLSAAQYNNARTFNAGMASLELMTDKINTLFTSNFNPTAAEIAEQAETKPIFRDGSSELYDFSQKVTQLGGNRALVTVLDPPFEGLTARERLFRLEAIAKDNRYNTQVRLLRDVANYQIPIFQFAVFGFESLDFSPGPNLWLGGRTHSNRNIFMLRRGTSNRARFYGKITTVGEICNEILPSGQNPSNGAEGVAGYYHEIYDPSVSALRNITPSVQNATGPDDPGVATSYDYNLTDDPTSPNGGVKTTGATPVGTVVTGIPRLQLPTESQGFQAIEILRRGLPTDNLPENEALLNTRFYNGIFARYSTIRILIDDDIGEFPDPIGGEPRAYDLDALANPNDPFWEVLANNVRQFNPNTGDDHPDRAIGTQIVGAGTALNQQVLPPQTNLINHQPEFQRTADGNVAAERKRTYIKIELLINDEEPDPPVRIDITRHILNLGITAGPIPTITSTLTAADLQGDNNATAPTGRLRASTTYVNGYPLNDTRLTSTAADNTNENMLPWLENSTTNANIGKYKAALGGGFPNSPALTFRDGVTPDTATIAYTFEPNAILRLQRTYFPYAPNNDTDMTTADVPAVSDGATPATPLNPGTGRIGGYPAKFKSLIAKPYFRFTDLFDNDSYVKQGIKPPSVTTVTKLEANGMYPLANPFTYTSPDDTLSPTAKLNYQKIYKGNGTAGNGTDTRFIRAVEFYSANSNTGSTIPGAPASGNSEMTTFAPATYGGLLPYDTDDAVTQTAGGVLVSGVRFTRDGVFTKISEAWSGSISTTTGTGFTPLENTNNRALIAKYIRENIFKPGIPGFYALAWDTVSGTNVSGDSRVDLDVNFRYEGTLPNSEPRAGVIDLQEMTPFPNLDPTTQQAALNAIRTNVLSLNEGNFPNLAWPNVGAIANPNGSFLPSYLKIDPAVANNTFDVERSFASFLAAIKNIEPGLTNPATSEFPKENLVFDWNGDGLIEPPHRPFQGGQPSRNSTISEGVAVGYSVESNICSLIPSTLRISPTPSTTADRTTSVPVEIRFVEKDAATVTPNFAFPTGGSASARAAALNGYESVNPDVGAPLNGQADPDPGAGTGFTDGVNSFQIDVPFNFFGAKRKFTKAAPNGYTITFKIRSAVRMVFQHPLAPRGVSATSYPSSVGFTAAQVAVTGNATQIGRNLGLTDVNYAFPGHCYLDFVSDPTNDNIPAGGTTTWLPRVRTITDRAFPINTYDQREARHVSRTYGFQGIPTSADYYSYTVGTGAKRIDDAQWPDWPGAANDERILYNLGQQLPMPSPVALERRGIMNIVELDLANLKKLFRGDFNAFLATIGGGFTSGQPRNTPKGDITPWGGNGIIDISDNGLMVYISDRRGDDNNDGIYELNDVNGENGVLDPLDDTTNTVLDPGSDQKGKPGDGILRRDVDVETQPVAAPTDAAPARTGESPHGSMPVNDGFEYFCGNINTTTWRITVPDNVNPTQDDYPTLLNGNGIADTMAGVTNSDGTAPAASQTGARNWRMVDSAKTGRVRAFRHAVRIVNGWDIPRWYLDQDGPVPRHFTGMSLISENPVYIHGNLNAIGVQVANSDANDADSGIPAGGPTQSRKFLQTGNANITRVPGNFNTLPAVSGGADDALLHGPMAIMSDAVSIHSRAFTDARMFLCPYGLDWRPQSLIRRIPMETTVKAAWLTGQPKAGVQNSSQNTIDTNGDGVNLNSGDSPNTQGGVHNFPRFCENWGGIRFNYNGSFIHQFYSHQANGQWLINGPNFGNNGPSGVSSLYNAPTRNWNFDQAFRKLGGLPPGTPRVSFYKIRGFRQVFIEDQD